MNKSERTWTFYEIDAAAGRAKGTAFRAFKRALPALTEGVDFQVFDAAADHAAVAALRRAGRLYASTYNAVVLYPSGYRRLCAELAKPTARAGNRGARPNRGTSCPKPTN